MKRHSIILRNTVNFCPFESRECSLSNNLFNSFLIRLGYPNAAKLLIAGGANVERNYLVEYSPLNMAAKSGKIEKQMKAIYT